jgi:hypothetical protein
MGPEVGEGRKSGGSVSFFLAHCGTTCEEDKGSKVIIIKLNNSTWVNHLKKGLCSWTKLNPR